MSCVYKLSATRKPGQSKWSYKIKLSEQLVKTSIPGIQQIKRFMNDVGEYIGDMVFDENQDLSLTIIDPIDPSRYKSFPKNSRSKLLLEQIVISGKLVYSFPALTDIQQRVKAELNSVHSGIKRFLNPHIYPAGLEENLYRIRAAMIEKYKILNLPDSH